MTLTIPTETHDKTVKARDVILLIKQNFICPIGIGSTEFLAQHALGTLPEIINFTIKPDVNNLDYDLLIENELNSSDDITD